MARKKYYWIYSEPDHGKWLNDQAYSNFKMKEKTCTSFVPEESLRKLVSIVGRIRYSGVVNWRFYRWRELIDSICNWNLYHSSEYAAVHITSKGIRTRCTLNSENWSKFYNPLKFSIKEENFIPSVASKHLPLSDSKKRGIRKILLFLAEKSHRQFYDKLLTDKLPADEDFIKRDIYHKLWEEKRKKNAKIDATASEVNNIDCIYRNSISLEQLLNDRQNDRFHTLSSNSVDSETSKAPITASQYEYGRILL
jgi:hypothetical protein